MTPNRLRHFRKRHGLTLHKLALRVGLTQAQMSRLENGKRGLDNDLAKRLAAIFGCSWLEVLGEKHPTLSADEQSLLARYRKLTPATRRAVDTILANLTEQPNGAAPEDDWPCD